MPSMRKLCFRIENRLTIRDKECLLSVPGQGEIESTTESALYEKAVLSNRETFDGKR